MTYVRASQVEDMDAVRRIYAHEVLNGRASFEEVPPDLKEILKRRQHVLELGLPHLVAQKGGKITGFAYASHHRPRPAYNLTVENSVYVAQGTRGTGVGKLLMSSLIHECEQGPWREVVAVIGDPQNAASIGLYTSLGFRHVGTLKSVGLKLGKWVDTVIMQRSLKEGFKLSS